MTTFCDTHAHIDFEAFDEDRDQIIERAKAAGLEFIINIGINFEGSSRSFFLPQQYPGYVYLAIGIHPNDSMDYEPSVLLKLSELAKKPEVVAIGKLDWIIIVIMPHQSNKKSPWKLSWSLPKVSISR